MADSKDVSKLMERLAIPKQYQTPPIIKVWFLEGAYDAMHGKLPSNEADMLRRVGGPATQAYQAGYNAARQLKNLV